jgi:hypothetical protein
MSAERFRNGKRFQRGQGIFFERRCFGDSGIVEMSPEFNELAAGGGREVKMPFWKDLTATRQILSDSASLAVNKIGSEGTTIKTL